MHSAAIITRSPPLTGRNGQKRFWILHQCFVTTVLLWIGMHSISINRYVTSFTPFICYRKNRPHAFFNYPVYPVPTGPSSMAGFGCLEVSPASTARLHLHPHPQSKPASHHTRTGRLSAISALADLSSSNDTTIFTDASTSTDHNDQSKDAFEPISSSTTGHRNALIGSREKIRKLSAMVSVSTNYETTLRSALAAQRLFLESDPNTPSLNSVLVIWGKVSQQLVEWHNTNPDKNVNFGANPELLSANDSSHPATVVTEPTEGVASSTTPSSTSAGDYSVLDEYLKEVDIGDAGVYTSKDAAMQAEALLNSHLSLATTFSYNTVMECWTKSRDESAPDKVKQLFDKIKNPDDISYNALVEAYAYCKNVENRLTILEQLPVSYDKSTRNCNALLHAYSKAASESDRLAVEISEKALEAYYALKQNYHKTGDLSQRPDIMTYNTVMDCLGRTGMKEYAQIADTLMDDLKRGCNNKGTRDRDNRYCPTISTFTTQLRAWGRVNSEEAFARCQEILDESIEWVGPHVNVFSCLIQVLGKTNNVEQPAAHALHLIQRMRSLSIEPTILTYNAALEACSKQREKGSAAALKIAFAIFKAVEQPSSPVSPNEWTYTALLSCVGALLPASEERNKIARMVFGKARNSQMVSKRTLQQLIKACDSTVFYNLLSHEMTPSINGKFDFDKIPAKWSKHSGVSLR